METLLKVWPVYRNFVKHMLAKRCTRCALSEPASPLEGGLCEICRKVIPESGAAAREGEQAAQIREDQFNEMLRSYAGRGTHQYDALLFFSGGKDSTYLLNRLLTEFSDLRVLAFTVDNGFRSSVAKRNVEKTCEYFQVDHVEIKAYKVFKKLYRFGFSELAAKGFRYIDILEGELFQDIGRHYAATNKIPLLLSGYTDKQVLDHSAREDFAAFYPENFVLTQKDHAVTRNRIGEIELGDVFDSNEMKFWWDGSRYSESDLPVLVYPFGLWSYDREDVIQIVEALNIVESVSELATNDIYVWLGTYLDYKIFGYVPGIEEEFTLLVRDGNADRKSIRNIFEVLEYLSLHKERSMLKQLSEVLEKLAITLPELDRIIRRSIERLEQLA